MSQVGSVVSFFDFDAEGEEIHVFGKVEKEFNEPLEEDPLQRLSYRVRTLDDRVFTPYAHECTLVKGA